MTPRAMAQLGLALLKEAVLDLLVESPEGMRNVDVSEKLGIHSDYLGAQKDYLSWSVLGMLLGEGRITRSGDLYKALN